MFYVVDAANRVVSLDDDWDAALARSGGAAHCLRERVLGRPLENFIAGDTTKMFVRSALDAVRLLGQSRSLSYRCDTPHERREFAMIISPHGPGQVKVAHVLQSHSVRAPAARARSGPSAARWRCSQCLAVRHAGSPHWTEADGLASGDPVATDVCPRCADRLFNV